VGIPNEVLDQFLAGTRTEAVRFVINDSVRVISGSNKKRTGAVVSVFTLEPVTTYLIEPGVEPWGDFQAAQSDLELIEP
jgi:hypothetical protein